MNKKIHRFITAILLTAIVSAASIPASAEAHKKGDVDCNGIVNINDATTIQRLLVGLVADSDGSIRRYGDIDGDGLSISDVTLIQFYLAEINNRYDIGKDFEYEAVTAPTETPTETQKPTEPRIINGKITIGEATFDVSKIPDKLTINDSSSVSKTLIVYQEGVVEPKDFSVRVNNGSYDCYTNYTDEKFKENYLMTNNGYEAIGYDCLVRNDKGEEAAWVCTHYEAAYAYPYRVKVFGLSCKKYTFPIEFFYKGNLLKRCSITINLKANKQSLESTLANVRKIEKACWSDSMTDTEKLKAFSKYVAYHYSYTQLMCVDGAEYVAFAARDLGLCSMLLYPGGEENQTCSRHIITYNLYFSTAVPGGHCACLVEYPDGSMLRYDVQGGSYWIRDYTS